MKNFTVLFSLLLTGLVLSGQLHAQEQTEMTRAEFDRMDSLSVEYENSRREDQKIEDRETVSDLKEERAKTKLAAKEAKRIEREANDAARTSKDAYKAEKKAQKLRKSADMKAKKAERARQKSSENK